MPRRMFPSFSAIILFSTHVWLPFRPSLSDIASRVATGKVGQGKFKKGTDLKPSESWLTLKGADLKTGDVWQGQYEEGIEPNTGQGLSDQCAMPCHHLFRQRGWLN